MFAGASDYLPLADKCFTYTLHFHKLFTRAIHIEVTKCLAGISCILLHLTFDIQAID